MEDEDHTLAWEEEEGEALHRCYLGQKNLSGHLFSRTEKKKNYYFDSSPGDPL